jgi:hypothetical protein
LQFASAAGNRVGVQAGDPGEMGDPAGPMLVGEEADQEAPGAFVGDRDEAIDPPMLSRQSAMGMLLAGGTGASMDHTPGMLLCHGTVPP